VTPPAVSGRRRATAATMSALAVVLAAGCGGSSPAHGAIRTKRDAERAARTQIDQLDKEVARRPGCAPAKLIRVSCRPRNPTGWNCAYQLSDGSSGSQIVGAGTSHPELTVIC